MPTVLTHVPAHVPAHGGCGKGGGDSNVHRVTWIGLGTTDRVLAD